MGLLFPLVNIESEILDYFRSKVKQTKVTDFTKVKLFLIIKRKTMFHVILIHKIE